MRDVLQQLITIMNVKEYKKVIYSSEFVVYDSSGRRVVACPTEQEADEYIYKNEVNKHDRALQI